MSVVTTSAIKADIGGIATPRYIQTCLPKPRHVSERRLHKVCRSTAA